MDRHLPPNGEPDAEETEALRELLISAVPEPAPVPDRLARIEFLVHRRRRRRLAGAAVATAAAAVIGFGALDLGGAGVLRLENPPAGSPTADRTPSSSSPSPTSSVRPSLSPTPTTEPTADGPTRTAQAGSSATAGSRTAGVATADRPPVVAAASLTIPKGSAGASGQRIGAVATDPPAMQDGSGIFKTICEYSHMSTTDPLTGKAATTLFTHWGNTAADAAAAATPSKGNSTCRGGTLDRSVYSFLSVIDPSTRRAIAPTEAQVFFHTGYEGVRPDQVETPPAGLRMSAGQTGNGYSRIVGSAVEWSCAAALPWTAQRPGCAGATLYLRVIFPQCWDGRLDSPDGRAHLAYASPGAGCPATHPRALPEITYRLLYDAPASGVDSWQLASVGSAEPVAGFVNGWDGATAQRWMSLCLTGARDCVGHIGDGQILIGDR